MGFEGGKATGTDLVSPESQSLATMKTDKYLPLNFDYGIPELPLYTPVINTGLCSSAYSGNLQTVQVLLCKS